jgi:hypothetical protein
MYNQDWLFCWCLQVRMGGKVYLDNTFEDVDFPARKCLTVVDGARHHVGIHHTNPRRMRALWKAYSRIEAKEAKEGNASTSGSGIDSGIVSVQDPSRPQDCRVDATLGRPYAHLPWKRRRRADTLPRPVQRDTCVSALDDASVRERCAACSLQTRLRRSWSPAAPQSRCEPSGWVYLCVVAATRTARRTSTTCASTPPPRRALAPLGARRAKASSWTAPMRATCNVRVADGRPVPLVPARARESNSLARVPSDGRTNGPAPTQKGCDLPLSPRL